MTRKEAIKINYLVGELVVIIQKLLAYRIDFSEKMKEVETKRTEISDYILNHISLGE